MINEHYLNMLSNKSVIRTLSEYATARGKEVGYENVFDFSLGNPSVPAPQSFKDVSISLLELCPRPRALRTYQYLSSRQWSPSNSTATAPPSAFPR